MVTPSLSYGKQYAGWLTGAEATSFFKYAVVQKLCGDEISMLLLLADGDAIFFAKEQSEHYIIIN